MIYEQCKYNKSSKEENQSRKCENPIRFIMHLQNQSVFTGQVNWPISTALVRVSFHVLGVYYQEPEIWLPGTCLWKLAFWFDRLERNAEAPSGSKSLFKNLAIIILNLLNTLSFYFWVLLRILHNISRSFTVIYYYVRRTV